MELQTEWNELLALLSRHGVRFVGGLAVAAHGRERYTKDLDVLVDTSQANARRLGRALAEFGFATTPRAWRRFQRPYQILTLGREPLRIDVLTSISGVSFRAGHAPPGVKLIGGIDISVEVEEIWLPT